MAVNERRLFHGTSPETLEAICKQNFDCRLHGKNAPVYGQGSYFALNASYSDAAKEDGDSSQFMFLAKVLVGSSTRGHSSYQRSPQKVPSNPASDLYDSCVDDISNPTVFDTDQCYPEYIIKYSQDNFSDSTLCQTAYGGFQQPVTRRSRRPVTKPRHSQAATSYSGAPLLNSVLHSCRPITPLPKGISNYSTPSGYSSSSNNSNAPGSTSRSYDDTSSGFSSATSSANYQKETMIIPFNNNEI